MKGMDIFCASQAATAICLNMDTPSSSNLLGGGGGGGGSSPAIDRYNPIITDSRRVPKPHPVFVPKPPKNHHKRKGDNKVPSCKDNEDHEKDDASISSVRKSIGRKSWSCTKPGDFFSPPGSTRYLLGDKDGSSINDHDKGSSEFNPSLDLVPIDSYQEKESDEAQQDQVVVLRVSLHCRGCEKKMRKHISRMKGVTSFNIDFAAKKVTVSGKITPVEVLTSISKVKNAQLWTPTTPTNLNFAGGSYKTYL